MIKFCVLGSGSKGNAVWISIDGYEVLFDCGFTFKNMRHRLAMINKHPDKIKEIFITHIHNDHCAGLKGFIKLGCQVWRNGVEYSGRLKVNQFKLQHDDDVPCWGYVITDNDSNSLLYITDTGSIPCDALGIMIDCQAIIVEANHDTETMIHGPYPDDLKGRIFATHLRNEQAHDLLSVLDWDGLKYVVGYHLSDKNNSPALAEFELKSAVKQGRGCEVVIAEQSKPTKIMVVML